MKIVFRFILFTVLISTIVLAEDGYRLWLRYDLISDKNLLDEYREQINGISFIGNSETMIVAEKELVKGLSGLLGEKIKTVSGISEEGIIIAALPDRLIQLGLTGLREKLMDIGDDGYIISIQQVNGRKNFVIAANKDLGILYGVFHFLRLIQTHKDIKEIQVVSKPEIDIRILNHWDNLDRTSERGYAGFSIWDWHKLPDYINPRYTDFARANASIGINGSVVTNVNSNALVLTEHYLKKVKALADVFRPYGVKIYLTARFSAPIEIGGLETADPLDPDVRKWWNEKVKEIYKFVPDFGGFLVKANSEGQPGPQNYGRSHAEGANLLAEALEPFGGVVMWRAFVYSTEDKDDRAKQAYKEFKPLDGKFRSNVLIQVKNGPIDFQPREPFHPMFGAFPETPLMMEFQITQEYLGQATHLVYLAPMYKEVLESDTYSKGKGSTVAKVIDGTLHNYSITGMAGVANIGTDRNWTGHTFGQSNWYAFGRLAWDYSLSSEEIAEEWIKMTFNNDENFVGQVKNMMLNSHENLVNYMTPLGLHHIMGWDHHYGPAPWIKDKHREEWTSVYYHKADKAGIGFDRTESGSNAVSQYFPEVRNKFSSLETCPEKYLLWFHHLDWDYKTISGRTLWNELVTRYYEGAETVKEMQKNWESIKGEIDDERFKRVKMLLKIQADEARWWRNACVLYFQTFSNRPIPERFEKPDKSLDYYMNLNFPYAPGIRPQW